MTDAPLSAPARVLAPAKLTLTLRVQPVRPDGYHPLEALCASVDGFEDAVEVTLTGGEFTLQVAGASDGVPGDASNLAVVAARALLARVEPGAGAAIRLRKVIPPGAGLGGGSTDAAAVLEAIALLLPDETEGVDLARLGADVGSDVPFCVQGGLAWMRGRGELVEPVEHDAPAGDWLAVVAVPRLQLSTAAVYAAWDELGGPRAQRSAPPPRALAPLTEVLFNDLEPAALAVEPRLVSFRDRFEEVAGRPAILAGSGSAYFTAFDADEHEAAEAVRAALGDEVAASVCRPVSGVRPIAG